jgi:hypothetical protein
MAFTSKDLGRGTVFSVLSVFFTEAAAEADKGFFVGALPVCAPAVAAIRTMHVKLRFQSIGTLELNFIKLESLCPFAKAVQQKLWLWLGQHFPAELPTELTVACRIVLLHY